MFRLATVVVLSFATLGGAVAGTIVPINLTTSPVGIGSCVGAGCTPTVSSTTTGTFENQYFTSVTAPDTPPPSSDPQTVGPTSFILAAQSVSPNYDTYLSPGGTNVDTSILIDLGSCTGTAPTSACGIYNVDSLDSMIQANSQLYGFQGVTVTLNGVGADGTTPITDIIDLTAGIDYRSSNSSLAPTSATCTDANSTGASCSDANSDTAQLSGTDSNPGGTGGNSVTTFNNVFGAEITTYRHYYLDVQELDLGSYFEGAYLDSVTITNDAPSGGSSKILFSGLSVDPSPAPEPGTIALFGIGLGLIALWKIRSRRATRVPVRG